MTEQQAPAEALVPTVPDAAMQLMPRAELMSDDEIRRMYRIAESLALSGMWKDIKKAEAAFAKMIIGRDLGMTPAQAMQGIHIVDGGIQMHYATLGQFIRARQGYDYRAGWIKEQPRMMIRDAETGELRASDVPAEQAFVWHDEEDPLDGRRVVGAAIVFTVDGVQRGVSRYTLDDAVDAGLIKDNLDKRAAWSTSRRNMLLARAMSNGVKWFVPEVMGGLPVYVAGELGSGAKASLTAGTTDAADEGQGIELGPQVEKVIARAEQVGHRGLMNRAAVELAVGNRSPGVVKDWCAKAHEALDRLQEERQAAEPTNAVVVDGEAVEEAAVSPADVPTGPSSAVSPNPDQVVATTAPADGEAVLLLRARLQRLEAIDPTAISVDEAADLQAEVEYVQEQLRTHGAPS
jgi:hypothetical protein